MAQPAEVGTSAPARSVVGERTATELEQGLGIVTVDQLLRHYPRRYYERGELADLAELREGDHVTVQARVTSVRARQVRPKLHKTDVRVEDGSGHRLDVTFFNRPWVGRQLAAGEVVLLSGTVRRFNRTLQLTNPELAVGADAEEFAGALLPVYPATGRLPSWNVAKAVRAALDVAGLDDDPVPADVRARRGLPGLREALELVHRPRTRADVTRAQRRLRYEEALAVQAALALRRSAAQAPRAVPRAPRADGLLARFDARMPFTLTEGQRAVEAELLADLAREVPMHRLLQGEVGSGKTLVALRAMLAVVDGGGQAALLAPTEVLAQQHARVLDELLGPLGQAGRLGGAELATRVALLTGSQSAAARREALLAAAGGAAGIVVGTHALLQEQVQLAELSLVVVDEQHRFGVEQRDALRAKAPGGTSPHVLVMTATPIPRTVAITVFGDLEVSTLRELPRGRSPLSTHVVTSDDGRLLGRVWERVREEVAAGRQAYVVCPRIGGDAAEDPSGDEPEDTQEVGQGSLRQLRLAPQEAGRGVQASVTEVLPLLRDGLLAGLRVEPLHGRLVHEAKDAAMTRFAAGEVDVLVATTVVEVGVDVPNATVMVVLEADRFGVSQLHQLRGRVGRGSAPGLCLLVTAAEPGSPALQRLEAVAGTTDGFALARVDLEHRKEGNVLGVEQSGRRSRLRLLSLLRDEEVIEQAREDAFGLVAADAGLERHPALRRAVHVLLGEDEAGYLEKA